MRRLLSLRATEEEQARTELGKQRHLREACLNALQGSRARQRMALHSLHLALMTGDRDEAVAAEMALAWGPLESQVLQQRCAHIERSVETAAEAWQVARIGELQIRTLVEANERRRQHDAQVREQKRLDAWFISVRPDQVRSDDENFPRELPFSSDHVGTTRANNTEE